jgi:hypothetical protein
VGHTARAVPDSPLPPPLSRVDKAVGGDLKFTLALTDIKDVTMVHIHAGAAGESGPVVVTLVPLPSDKAAGGQLTTPLSAAAGRPISIAGAISPANFTDSLEGMTADEFVTEMGTGDFYVNVHTVEVPASLIRGQVTSSVANGTVPSMMSPAMGGSPPVKPDVPASSAPAFQIGVTAAVASVVAALL